MRVDELKEVRNIKVENLEHFKNVVVEAVESTCRWKKYGSWLYEEYEDCSDKGNQYKAIVIVMNECYNPEAKQFHIGYSNISSVTIYDIFYTDTCGGGFVVESIDRYYDAIKSFELLLKQDC